jgi:hypothetical protein
VNALCLLDSRLHTHTHTHKYVILTHCNNGFTNSPQCYTYIVCLDKSRRTLYTESHFVFKDFSCSKWLETSRTNNCTISLVIYSENKFSNAQHTVSRIVRLHFQPQCMPAYKTGPNVIVEILVGANQLHNQRGIVWSVICISNLSLLGAPNNRTKEQTKVLVHCVTEHSNVSVGAMCNRTCHLQWRKKDYLFICLYVLLMGRVLSDRGTAAINESPVHAPHDRWMNIKTHPGALLSTKIPIRTAPILTQTYAVRNKLPAPRVMAYTRPVALSYEYRTSVRTARELQFNYPSNGSLIHRGSNTDFKWCL